MVSKHSARALSAAFGILGLQACATVRQEDLASWVNAPVAALDLHSIFATMPMYRTVAANGVEMRNYVNSEDISRCFGTGNAYSRGRSISLSAFSTCRASSVTCNNIFYVQGDRVLEYRPTGSCYTDKRAQPEARWLQNR